MQTQVERIPTDFARSMEGSWEEVRYRFHYLPVHLVLLRTGKVLAFGGTGNDETATAPHPAEIWNPETGKTDIVDQELGGDIFCAGQVQLVDGRILVAGGTSKYDGSVLGLPVPPFTGVEDAYIFDPVTERWTRAESMRRPRWYPTLIALGNGNAVAMAGLMKRFPWIFRRSIEVFDSAKGWRRLNGANRWLPLYPRLHLLPNGNIFYSGSYNTHYTFPFSLWAFPTSILEMEKPKWASLGLPRKSEREEGTSVLLPLEPPDYKARVLLAGGGTPGGKQATSAAEIIDLSSEDPQWRQIESMKSARYYAYAVILPDKSVFVLGGRTGTAEMNMGAVATTSTGMGQNDAAGDPPHDSHAILETELFDPETETWKKMPEMTVDRMYHSNAILLPDGRVMTAGSNPARRVNELRIETYKPPYFYKGTRPVIDDSPSGIRYGSSFEIKTASAKDIRSVAMIRPSATTHCVNTDQRYVGLEFESNGSFKIVASVPSNMNLLPKGFYMLFIVTEDRIPSIGKFVQIA